MSSQVNSSPSATTRRERRTHDDRQTTARPRYRSTRAVGYVRVSSEEQVEGYSLDAQQRAIQHYCDANGWTLVDEYRDEGRSARSDDIAKRLAFAEMLVDANAGLFDIIICHKLDRFARNLRATLDTLNRDDVAFASIFEQMDFRTPIGKGILATLGAFAQYYSANLSHETRKGKTERKRQGMYNGVIPFGMTKGDERGCRWPTLRPTPASYWPSGWRRSGGPTGTSPPCSTRPATARAAIAARIPSRKTWCAASS
jgi:DNA invertase Pin-like site-specific DNA recombinase